MSEGLFARLRAVVLLAAFGIGLAGQAIAFAPMAMAQDEGQTVAAAMGGMAGCPDCAGGNSSDTFLAPVNCALAFCSISISPAILPQGPAISHNPAGRFAPPLAERAQGLSILPDLGPPRLSHQA
jgi:hypothetical protein